MAQVTVLFANKGGVGKTTTTLHLALAMARAGKRVLVYDCDSQRNLSQSLLAHELKKDNGDWNAMTKRLVPQGQYASLYEQHTAARLYLPVPCAKRKREREDDATVSTASTASTAPDFAAFAHKIDAGREGEGGGELFLVQGHKHTYKMDATIQIAEALKALNYPNYEAARVRSIVAATAARYKCDMVLMDLSPNAGALNRYLVWNADHLLIPCLADYYSCETLDDFADLAADWQAEILANRSAMMLADQPIKMTPPKLLGIILSLFLDQQPDTKQAWVGRIMASAEALSKRQELKEWMPKKRSSSGGSGSMVLATLPSFHDKGKGVIEEAYDALVASINIVIGE